MPRFGNKVLSWYCTRKTFLSNECNVRCDILRIKCFPGFVFKLDKIPCEIRFLFLDLEFTVLFFTPPPHPPLSVTSEMKRDQNFPVVTSSGELFLYLWCFSSRKLSCSATRAHLLGISCTRERQMNIVLRSNLIETAFLLLELIISSVV